MSQDDTGKPLIGFAGLTHLGINTLVATAEKGFSVVGFENNQTLIESLQNKILHVEEPLLAECLEKNFDAIRFTSSAEDLSSCDIIYISTDVPTDEKGKSDLRVVNQSIEEIVRVIKNETLLVILCQVNPGFTREVAKRHSNVCYQVETLVFGNAMQRALFPERFMVGCENPDSELLPFYKQYLSSFNCPILKMRFESAELAKIAINMFLVSSVSTTNMLASICENIGASWAEIAPALRLDKRIGPYAYLKPGLGISGGNLERDLATICDIARKHDVSTSIVDSWTENSKIRKDWAYACFRSSTRNLAHARIGILGLSYKENTHSIKNSPAVTLLQHLEHEDVITYDPVVKDIGLPYVKYADSIQDLLNDIDVLFIMTPWDEFKHIPKNVVERGVKGKIVIDPYGLFAHEKLQNNGFTYFSLGEYAQ